MSSSTLSKRARANAQLIDQLEQGLLTFKPLVKLLKVFGVEPASPDVKRLVSYMMAGLYYGIKRTWKDHAPQPASDRRKWTLFHDTNLMLEIECCRKRYGVSEREAVSLIAEAFPPETHCFPYRANGRKSPKFDPRARYEEALWRRWMMIKQRNKQWEDVRAEFVSDDPFMIALGFGRSRRGLKMTGETKK
jgi:hypothetical protein